MGWTIVSLQEIFYDWQIAFFIYVLIQAFLTGLAFAVSVWYAYRHLKTGKCTAIFMFLAYSILPIYPASVQTISKDALSTWAFVIFAVLIMEGVRTEGNVFSSWKYLLSVTILALFCSLTRKVNPYVVLLSLLVLLVFIRHKRFFLLIPIMAVSIIMFGLLPHLFSRYGVEPGGKQEMFSIPFQQTARYVEDYPDDITHEEYLAIDHLLYMEDLVDRYNPISADGVKGFWELGETDDYVRYLKAWFAEGLRHPFAYVDAFNAMLAGWFSFEEYDPMMNMDSHSQLNTDYLPDYITMRDEPFDESAAFYQNMFDVIYGIPVLNLLFTYGFYAILIPAFSLWTTIIHHRQRKKHDWLALVPMLSSLILGCFLAPLSVYSEGRRYLYPLTYTMPLMIAWCVFICKSAVASHLQKG